MYAFTEGRGNRGVRRIPQRLFVHEILIASLTRLHWAKLHFSFTTDLVALLVLTTDPLKC